MQNQIYIKSAFGNWQLTERNTAKWYISYLFKQITTTSDINKKCAFIEKNHLKGITCKELLGL
jgi:hypothetical protein